MREAHLARPRARRRRRSRPPPRRRGAARGTVARRRGPSPARACPPPSGSASPRATPRGGSAGRIDGRRRASIVLPVPGGPARRRLCVPAAASSSARRPRSCPRTSPRSGSGRRGGARLVGRSGRDLLLAPQVGDGLGEVAHADGLDPCESRLAAPPRAAQRTRARPARAAPSAAAIVPVTGRTRPSRPSSPMHAWLGEPLARKLRRRREHRQRDREVEARPLLPQRRGREVDRDRLARPLEERRVDAAPHAVLRLLAGSVCEADDREGRLFARPQVRLDLDATRLEPDERERDGAAEHLPTLRPNASQVCAAFVPRSCRRVGRARRPTRRSARRPRLISRRSRGRTA